MLKPTYNHAGISIYHGDCRDVLRELPGDTVDCCITSPPYWGLRNYGVDGQIGLEASVDEYVAELVAVFREVRRLLKDSGTLWLNMGDAYVANRGNTAEHPGYDNKAAKGGANFYYVGKRDLPGLKPKDLIGLPWRVAFALQSDGWWLRSEITWCKRAPMPESVTDRPTSATEKIFLLAKAERYYYDADAVKEPSFNAGQVVTHNNPKPITDRGYDGHRTRTGMHGRNIVIAPTRNLRNFWLLGPEPFPEAHFATFPTAIPKRAILAGCPSGGVVLDPFLGSGTTALVAKNLGRRCLGVEMNRDYIDIAVDRLRQEILPLEVTA